MKHYPTAILLMICAVLAIALRIQINTNFSPPEPGVSSPQDGPALMSCLELQRELNRRDPKLKLAEDGICGPATMAAWDEVVFNGYALETWPVKARMESAK